MKTGLVIGSFLVLFVMILLIVYWRKNTSKSKKIGGRVDQYGFIGAFIGGTKAAAGGISAAIFFGYIASLISKPKMKKQ